MEPEADPPLPPSVPRPNEDKEAIRAILAAFLVSRAVLTFIGVTSRVLIGRQRNVGGYAEELVRADAEYPLWLSIWGVWDTRWYLNVADHWYSAQAAADGTGQAAYAFFPLYPLLMRIAGFAFGSSFIGGLLVSNLALIAAAWFLYRLVAMETDHRTGLGAALFLLLCPVGFIFSAVFSEAVFLACTISAFYCARRSLWLYAGVLGGLAALSRVPGVFILLPLVWEYLKARDYDLHRVRPDVSFLALIPLGLGLFMLQCWWLTGDLLAFIDIQKAWDREWANPISALATALGSGHLPYVAGAGYALAVLLAVVVFHRRIGPVLLLWALILTLLPLSSSVSHYALSLPRYMAVVFPLFIIMAKIPRRSPWRPALIVALALLQGSLMVFWTNNFLFIL